MAKKQSVLVTGDIVCDNHIYEGERARLLEVARRGLHMMHEAGGAALTHRLIQAVLEQRAAATGAAWETRLAYDLPQGDDLICGFPPNLRSYATWQPSLKANSKVPVWRIGRCLGYGPADTVAPAKFPKASVLRREPPTILVLDDAGGGFRHIEQQMHWHLPLPRRGQSRPRLPQWVVLKLAGTVGAGDLWRRLERLRLRNRLVTVVSVDVLRLMETQLSPGLSWERTAEQLVRELASNPCLRPLRQCRHLIVSFHHDGAAWVDFSSPKSPAALLVFDPACVEGEWSEGIQGDVFGCNTCLTAAVVGELACSIESGGGPDVPRAMERGLSGMRRLREDGHGPVTSEDGRPKSGSGFPVEAVSREIDRPGEAFGRAVVPIDSHSQQASSQPWSILARTQGPMSDGRPLYGFARQLALRGEAALKGVPHLRIGRLLTASRHEMEALRIIKTLFLTYRDSRLRNPRPLSIGVFGPPGAGKSFGVRELATGVFADPGATSYDGWMEFNLSQFDDTSDLMGAFHQIRDRVLEGLVPVVFWDEFDSGELKWLQYLLAPMQDGKFQEGQITHRVGQCVFVFAGATASSFAEFGSPHGHGASKKSTDDALRRFRLAKGPDFKSRLDASLDVSGPNPIPGDGDVFCPVRRAILIRALLGCGPYERLDIDSGLLTALLEVRLFAHGARSLEKLLQPLKASLKAGMPVRRSQLAPADQLALHVNVQEFQELCHRDEPFREDRIVKVLAPAIHEVWRRVAKAEGRKPRYDMAYGKLPPEIKRSNEAAARRMPENLALVGLRLVPGARRRGADEQAVRAHPRLHVELLAEAEHDGWMAHLLSEGWRYSRDREDKKRLHDCLLPYRELREKDREKDRESVLHYPDFARKAGWRIVFGQRRGK